MDFSGIHLLLADNDMDDCLLFTEALEELSFKGNLTTLHDGEQLIQFLKQTEHILPDMLFLDLNMPRKNGFECLAEIMMDEALRHLPVVIYSTSFEIRMANQLFNKGASIYIQKPPDFSTLKNVVQKAIMLLTSPGSLPGQIEKTILFP